MRLARVECRGSEIRGREVATGMSGDVDPEEVHMATNATLETRNINLTHTVRSYGAGGTVHKKHFDDIVRLACKVCHTPIGVIALTEHGRLRVSASTGLSEQAASDGISICAH